MVSVTPLRSRDPERKDSTCNHSITKRHIGIERCEKIGFEKRREKLQIEQRAVQYLPGDRVVEILRLPGKGEFDCDAKKRRQREERCCCCGSKRGSVFGRHVSFCEEAFLCVWQLETLSCIFTLTFLLLEVVVIKTNLFCVFRQRIVVCK